MDASSLKVRKPSKSGVSRASLTCSHELGIQAKISCVESRELSGERLICVYTYDSDDMEDLQRVVDNLRSSIDPKHRLIYKEDSMTRAGFYQDADRRVSKWYVRAFREDH